MELILASSNQGKLREIRAILGQRFTAICSMKEAGIDHETVEDGKTFLENAQKKAREIARISGKAALADDSGLCVEALDGAPGIYSARFAGKHGDDDANNRLLVASLQGKENRRAYYACAVSLCLADGTEYHAEGRLYGEIIDEARGTGGFGYDPYFYLPDFSCTAAELPPEVKNSISHRAEALRGLCEILDKTSCK